MIGGLALCASLSCASTSEAQTGAPRGSVHSFGTAFVLRHGISATAASGTVESSMKFRLPHSANPQQGRSYILDIAVQALFAQTPRFGATTDVGVLTDGRMAASISFTGLAFREQRGVWWSTYELFSGPAAGVAMGTGVTLHFRNYLQIGGLHSSLNAVSLRLQQFRGGVVRSVRILPGSRIVYSTLGPASLRVHGWLSPARIRAGDTVYLHYKIESQGMPARDVGTAIGVSQPGLILLDPPSRFMAWVTRWGGVARFQALVPGRFRVRLLVRGRTGGVVVSQADVEVRLGGEAHHAVGIGLGEVAGLKRTARRSTLLSAWSPTGDLCKLETAALLC